MAIFCEDIRQDTNGSHSLIGILGENMSVPHFPGMMPKLGLYVRILFHERIPSTPFSLFLHKPNGDRDELVTIERDFVERIFDEAAQTNNAPTTILSQLIASPFAVEAAGRHWIELAWDGGTLDIGGLNFVLQESLPADPDQTA